MEMISMFSHGGSSAISMAQGYTTNHLVSSSILLHS